MNIPSSNQCHNVPSAPNTTHELPPTPTKTTNNMDNLSTYTVTRKLLSLAAFFMAFATVMTVLIIYMDNTGKYSNISYL